MSAHQFEEHIEYLKGELARAISQLNATRTELEEAKEAIADANREIEAANAENGRLQGKLRAARTELARQPIQHREPERSAAAPSAPSVASSFRSPVPSSSGQTLQSESNTAILQLLSSQQTLALLQHDERCGGEQPRQQHRRRDAQPRRQPRPAKRHPASPGQQQPSGAGERHRQRRAPTASVLAAASSDGRPGSSASGVQLSGG